MNDIISKIYNSQYFVIGLFILIIVLAILFVVLIFSGKKKKNKKEEVSNQNLENKLDTINSALDNKEEVNNTDLNNNMVTPNIQAGPEVNSVTSENNNNEIDKMSFSAEPINIISNVAPANEINDSLTKDNNLDSAALNNKEDLYNTSIFRDMPTDIQTMTSSTNVPSDSVVQPTISNENDITNNLFEPLPDLSTVDIPLNNVENPLPKVEEIDISTDNSKEEIELPAIEPVVPVMPEIQQTANNNEELHPYQEERIQMPNQFSSVYINKEEPQTTTPVNNVNNNSEVKAYDPTLFETIAKPAEINIANENAISTDIPQVKTANETPVLTEIPESQPVENSSSLADEKPATNGFNFELPTLASEVENQNSNIVPETYNID